MSPEAYPRVKDPARVGTYPALVHAGCGYVWDAVPEYRVWCHPHDGAPDTEDGNNDYYAFEAFADALGCAESQPGCEEPLALVLQEEYIDEPEEGSYVHVQEPRMTEWPVEFLSRPRRNAPTIPDFLSPAAPDNRLDILRGLA